NPNPITAEKFTNPVGQRDAHPERNGSRSDEKQPAYRGRAGLWRHDEEDERKSNRRGRDRKDRCEAKHRRSEQVRSEKTRRRSDRAERKKAVAVGMPGPRLVGAGGGWGPPGLEAGPRGSEGARRGAKPGAARTPAGGARAGKARATPRQQPRKSARRSSS